MLRACGAIVCTSTRPAVPAAAGAPGELGDQRERPLLGAEVGEAQRRVGVEHDAERDAVEVVPLGDHLRADQHARAGALEARSTARRGPCAPATSASRRKIG
jgi:hypothetical protein